MRELAVLRMVWASAAWMAVEMFTHQHVANIEEVGSFSAAHDSNSGAERGTHGPRAVLRAVARRRGAGEARLAREEAKDGHERDQNLYMDLYHVRCKLKLEPMS